MVPHNMLQACTISPNILLQFQKYPYKHIYNFKDQRRKNPVKRDSTLHQNVLFLR